MSKKTIIATVAASLLLVVCIAVIALNVNNDKGTVTVEHTNTSEDSTQNEMSSGNHAADSKVSVIEENEAREATENSAGKSLIKPVVVFANISQGVLEATAYAPVVESNGKCTYKIVLSDSGAIHTQETETLPDASTTRCAGLSYAISELGQSTSYRISVDYQSSKSEGVSDELVLEIQ